MAGKTNGRAPRSLRARTVAPTMTSMLAMPRLPAPTSTVSPRLIGRPAAARASATERGMSGRVAEKRSGARAPFGGVTCGDFTPAIVVYTGSFDACRSPTNRSRARARGRRWVRLAQAAGHSHSARRGALSAGGESAEREAVRGRTEVLHEDRRTPSQFLLRAAGALPARRSLLPRCRVRQGRQGIRDVPVLLPAPSDRRSRAVSAGHGVLRPGQADRTGSDAGQEGAGGVQDGGEAVSGEPLRHRQPGQDRKSVV